MKCKSALSFLRHNSTLAMSKKIKLAEEGPSLSPTDPASPSSRYVFYQGYRIVVPHPFVYKTQVKERWVGKSVLEVFQTEFRDRPSEYYTRAIERGCIHINGAPCPSLDTRLKMNDRIEHLIHRHEPAVNAEPLEIMPQAKENGLLVVNKPSGIPVHPTGRYYYNTVKEILREEHGLTSGVLLIALNKAKATEYHSLMADRNITKDYVAKVAGVFPHERILVDEALITVSHKLGLSAITKDTSLGKSSQTLFTRLAVLEDERTSIVHCRPYTGRTHQIRIHLQSLGHPVVGDDLYGDPVWQAHAQEPSPSSHARYWSREELMQVSRALLARLVAEETKQEISSCGEAFAAVVSEPERLALPPWFDPSCEECQRQWLRTSAAPEIPLVVPVQCRPSHRDHAALHLHAYRYATQAWEHVVPLPLWAQRHGIDLHKAKQTSPSLSII